jgi:hypothetical protein
MIPNSLAMLTDSEIISVQALTQVISQQSNLPIELQSEFHQIGTMLAADPDYIRQAITRSVELVKKDLSLQTNYQSARQELRSTHQNNRKSKVDYSGAAESNANSQEIRNRFRDRLLAAGNDKVTTPAVTANPVAKFIGGLFGKK